MAQEVSADARRAASSARGMVADLRQVMGRHLGGYTGGMPKISVYLPDELYGEARAHKLPISALTQRAIEDALAAERTRDWAQRVRERAARCHKSIDTAAVMDEVREEFGQ